MPRIADPSLYGSGLKINFAVVFQKKSIKIISMSGSAVGNSSFNSHVENGSLIDKETSYSMHGGILFIQAAIVLFAGLLIPIPPAAIDILWAVNIIFTLMLVCVVFLAKDPADITSVPLVVIFITLLRLGTNVGAAKSILLIANGGRIISWIGERTYYGFVSIIVTVILVFLVSVLICKATNFIRFKCINYLIETIPNRQKTLDAEVKLGTVTQNQMLRVQKHIDKQKRFFAGMASTSSLLLCDCIITLIITIATTIGAAALGILNASAIGATSEQYFPLALAIAIVTAVPAGFVVLALRLLINKRFLITLKIQSTIPQSIYVPSSVIEKPTIKQETNITAVEILPQMIEKPNTIIESESITEQEFIAEPVKPETANNAQASDTFEQIIESEIKPEPLLADSAKMEPLEAKRKITEVGIQANLPVSEKTTSPIILRDSNYYDSILATVGDKEKAAILLLGAGTAQLPVTIAVELVMNIIELNKKCLLIDMDPARQAVSIAFDIDSSSMQAKAVPTGIQNLWVSPADGPENSSSTKLARKIAKGLKVFDYVVLYAPNAASQSVQQQLSDFSDTAIIFGTEEESEGLEEFLKTIASKGCRTVSEQELCVFAV